MAVYQRDELEELKTVVERKNDILILTLKVTADRLKLFLDCRKNEEAQAKAAAEAAEKQNAESGVADLVKARLPSIMSYLEIKRGDVFDLLQDLVHHPAEINMDVIDDIVRCLNAGEIVERRRVSKGVAPINGRDAKLLYLVKRLEPPKAGQQLEFVDLRFIRQFDNLEKGTPVARVYPPHDGIDGYDAFGEKIPGNAGKPFTGKFDPKTLALQAERGRLFETLVTQEAGYLTEEKGLLTIKHELALRDDLDFKTGDIDFIGDVKVRGNVMKEFKLFARGEIEIQGNVIDGMVQSRQGNITVKGSITGDLMSSVFASERSSSQMLEELSANRTSQIRSAGWLRAGLLQGTSVEANGDIHVAKEVQNSALRTGGMLKMSDGHLFGGVVYAACGVEAKVIGSPSGAHTVIFLCSDIESSIEYSGLLARIETHNAAEEMLKLYLGPYVDSPKRIERLRGEHRAKTEQLLFKLRKVRESRQELFDRRDNLLAKAKYNAVYRVNFNAKLYRGVIVYAGGLVFAPEEEIAGPKTIELNVQEGRFDVTEKKDLVCELGNAKKHN